MRFFFHSSQVRPGRFTNKKCTLYTTWTSCAGGRHDMPRALQVDLWPFDLESGVQVTCDVGYLCANFSLPRPLCSRLRHFDRQTSDVKRTSLLNAPTEALKSRAKNSEYHSRNAWMHLVEIRVHAVYNKAECWVHGLGYANPANGEKCNSLMTSETLRLSFARFTRIPGDTDAKICFTVFLMSFYKKKDENFFPRKSVELYLNVRWGQRLAQALEKHFPVS